MQQKQLKYVFTSNKINELELKNRIVMPAVHLCYCPDGQVNDKLIDFYRARAKGGAGLIIVGGCAIDDVGSAPAMINVSDDSFLPGLKQLTAAVKGEGAKIGAQLYQAGRYAHARVSGKKSVAPSPIPSRLTRETPHELTISEIQELVEKFAAAAKIVKEAGFDAVEILASAGYLISQFLSPLTNERSDQYGGSMENRMRFGIEVIQAIRAAVGPDYPIIVRVAGNDFMPGSNTNKEAVLFCQKLEESGADAINVTGGWHETAVPQITMGVPPGAFVYLAANIKKHVAIPVIACNRINDPLLAENILASGKADFVGIARGLIADPELPNKAQAGQLLTIRKCIGCNQGCLDHTFSMRPVTCLVNPLAGREGKADNAPLTKEKKILVVGGGPAGLEAARAAAVKGHLVTLWEKHSELGGQLTIAAAPPGRGDFRHISSYYINELAALNVQIKLNQEATLENIAQADFDEVIIATGATARGIDFDWSEDEKVISAWDVLAGNCAVGNKVVIVGGGAVGVETALYLAAESSIDNEALRFLLVHGAEAPEVMFQLATGRGGRDITIVEMVKGIGKDIGLSTRWTMLADLKRAGVKIVEEATVTNVTNEGVEFERAGATEQVAADTVILAVGSVSLNSLYYQLKDKGISAHLIGDAQKPAKALDAIHNSFQLANSL
ncbi:MAG: FAD-dependent oxidoreductase [Bacillota bacterium]|nr:FAD-dependent oxidoreductase [Bacillota bacterium]